MEMKLNTHRVKTLRLNLSWSQEKLAEEAGLNPRTIQRVETEGTASLHTRLCLAKALGVEPHELDLTELPATSGQEEVVQQREPGSLLGSWHHLPLLLLISLVYLAWTPLYFSLSRSGANPSPWPLTWWVVVTFAFWVPLALLWLSVAYYKHRSHIRLHLAYVGTLVCACVLMAIQGKFTLTVLTLTLYLSGVALLCTFYRATRHQALIRRVFFICLATYVFVWVLHGRVSGFLIGNYVSWERDLSFALPWVSFPTYVLRMLRELPQLFPVVLVLLFDLGRSRVTASAPTVAQTSP